MFTYDFSTLYTPLPHILIKDKLIDLIERTFQREGSPYLACSDRNAFFTSEKPKKYHAGSCQNVCDALTFLLDNIFSQFGTKLYRQVVGIPMCTNCAPLVADLFLFCYERDFMMSLSDDNQADVIDAFKNTSRYLDDILNINNVYFDNTVSQIYPSELQLNKVNTSDTEGAFLDLHLSISNDIVSTKIYNKHDDFDFEIANFPFLDCDVPRSKSYGVYISQLIRFARVSAYGCLNLIENNVAMQNKSILKRSIILYFIIQYILYYILQSKGVLRRCVSNLSKTQNYYVCICMKCGYFLGFDIYRHIKFISWA